MKNTRKSLFHPYTEKLPKPPGFDIIGWQSNTYQKAVDRS